MINTYQTSLAAPPVPPRLSRSQTVLIPAPLPSTGHSNVLIRCLVGAVMLHFLLSVGGFIFLYHNDQMQQMKQVEDRSRMKGAQERQPKENGGRAAFLSSDDQETSSRALARMAVRRGPHTASKTSGYLQWDMNHSFRRKINYYQSSWLTILQPGDYFVYSRVTFSKNDPLHPLGSIVKLRTNETGKEKDVMMAYCSLDESSGSARIPRKCTATQGELITLEKGNQLSLWVQDLSLVNYEDGATTFGMYKL